MVTKVEFVCDVVELMSLRLYWEFFSYSFPELMVGWPLPALVVG